MVRIVSIVSMLDCSLMGLYAVSVRMGYVLLFFCLFFFVFVFLWCVLFIYTLLTVSAVERAIRSHKLASLLRAQPVANQQTPPSPNGQTKPEHISST